MFQKVFIIVICALVLSSCTGQTGKLATPIPVITNNPNWIQLTTPNNGEQKVSALADITLFFNQDIDPSTLNEQNITIIEGKHSREITKLFTIKYESAKRMVLLESETDYGSSNGIDITISGHIKNAKGEEMGIDYHFGFSTADIPSGVSSKSNKQINYLALGDSIAAGVSPFDDHKTIKSYPDFIAEELNDEGFLINYEKRYAIKGYTTFNLLNDIQNDKHVDLLDNKDIKGIRLNIAQADIITLDIGANDFFKRKNYTAKTSNESDDTTSIIEEVNKNVELIIGGIQELNPKVKIYLMGYYNMLPTLSDKEQIEFLKDLSALNQALKQSATDNEVIYIPTDMLVKMENSQNILPVAFNVHLNEAGNKKLADIFMGLLLHSLPIN